MFRDLPTPSRPPAPPPGQPASAAALPSPEGDRHASAPSPPPRARAAPKDPAGAGAMARGREERTHRSRGRHRSPPPAARRGARSAPPPAPGAGPPLLPCTPLLPLRTCGLKAEIARLLGGRRESSPCRSVASLEGPEIWRHDLLIPQDPGVPATASLLSNREVRQPSHFLSQDPGHAAPAHLHPQV